MVLNDPLANVLSKMLNAEKLGKSTCSTKNSSKVIKNVLSILQDNQYIGEFKETDNGRGGILDINLIGKVNKCGVIKPKFNIKKTEFVKFEKRFLPSKGFGIIIISTSEGLMTLNEAQKKGIGGKLIAYCY